MLPLEDDFCDILRKALRGTGTTPEDLARRTGIALEAIRRWLAGEGAPDDAQAKAIARELRLHPERLADAAARRWYPPPVDSTRVTRHAQAPHPSNGYLCFDRSGRRAALIDPAGDPSALVRTVRERTSSLAYLLVTHRHADHCDAVAEVAAAFPDARIVIHRDDAAALGAVTRRAQIVAGGERLPFGEDEEIAVLFTPGHTDGSACYLIDGVVFTGDTLFAGSIGGAYADHRTYDDLLHSIRTKLFTLPGGTIVMPGHGPPTMIDWERHHNPFFTMEIEA